jgi:ABC-type Fe3+ transport system substrate-binding protein
LNKSKKGFYGVYIKVPVGDISSDTARKLVAAFRTITLPTRSVSPKTRAFILKYVRKEALPALYEGLLSLNWQRRVLIALPMLLPAPVQIPVTLVSVTA